MSTTQSPSAQPPHASPRPAPAMADVFGRFWPEDGLPARASLLLAGVGVGVLAGIVLPERNLGLGTFLVLMAFGATVFYAAKNRRDPFTLTCAGICVLLTLPVVVRDAEWIAVPCLFIGSIVCTAGLARGRSLPDFVVAAASWPLAGLRGMPWLGRTLRSITGTGHAPAVMRTAIWSLLGLIVFGLLFASADALFAEWADAVVPDLQMDMFVARFFVTVAVAGVTLAAAYLALNPPAVPMAAGGRRPVQSRYEWLAPVALVDLVFLDVPRGAGDGVLRRPRLPPAHHRPDVCGVRAPGLRPADRRDRADPAGGLGRVPQGVRRDGRGPALASWCPRPVVRAGPGRRRLGALPDAPLPGGLRLQPAPAARRRLRDLARPGRRRRHHRGHPAEGHVGSRGWRC